MKLRKVIFWCHLTAGVTAGLVILIMSFTGVTLMYAPQILAFAERHVRQVSPPANRERLSLDELIAKARKHNPDFRPTGIMLRAEPTAAVSVGFGREGALYVNPYTGDVLGQGSKIQKWFHAMEDWHRWLGQEGDGRATSRSITGACNLAFFFLAVSGAYLWWPRQWRWRAWKSSLLFNGHLRGKARDWNWHNVIGFWSSTVLVILTLTAAVMSYPWANDLLYTLTGGEPPPRPQAPAGVTQRPGRGAGQNEGSSAKKPAARFDSFLARAEQQAPGWTMLIMRFPPRGDGPVTVSIQEPTAPHQFARSQLTLNRATADVVRWEPYSQNSMGRKLRSWVRALHTGEAFGLLGQSIAGLASLGGCFLVWTGLSMAWRRLRSRRRRIERSVALSTTIGAQVAPAPTASPETPGLNLNSEQYHGSADGISNGKRESMDRTFAEQNLMQKRPSDGKGRLLILFGTVTGNAESIANQTALAAAGAGFDVKVEDMARCNVEILTHQRYLAIITSTHGNGEAPETAMPFWQTVVRGHGLDLRKVSFSVLALGNSTYDHFCQCGRDFDAALERHGATRFYPRVDCDADYDAAARAWINGIAETLQRQEITTTRSNVDSGFSELASVS